ncbi:MAG: glycosyltransferase family 4 protein [Myxococcota bacterium]
MPINKNHPHILYVTTHPIAIKTFYLDRMRFLVENGFRVSVVSSPGAELDDVAKIDGVSVFPLKMSREIDFKQDPLSLVAMIWAIRKIKPNIIVYATAKAALLAGIAAKVSGVPLKIFEALGLRSETKEGAAKKVIELTERLTFLTADKAICISNSLLALVAELGLSKGVETTVLGHGSVNGVKVEDFAPTEERLKRAQALKVELGISDDALTVGFIGRHTHDKGVVELVTAFKELKRNFQNIKLLLVGSEDKSDPPPRWVREAIKYDPDILDLGFVPELPIYYHLFDIFVLPTYREGLPNVLLEASAAEKAIVATRATGCVDVITDGETGFLVPIGDAKALASAIARLLKDPNLRRQLGKNARAFVEERFDHEEVTKAFYNEYVRLLKEKNLFIPDSK